MVGAPGFWGCRRSRYKAASSSPDLGSLVVTHPFHPLFGQCLPVLFTKRRAGAVVLVCEGGVGELATVTLLVSWTDRGPVAAAHRLSVEALTVLDTLITAIVDLPSTKDHHLV
jgi:hypothetical protein